MRSKSRKTLWLFLLVAGLGVLVFVAAARSGRDRPVPVPIARAVRQNLISWTSSNGKVEPVEPHTIQSPLTTRIEKVSVKEGETVKIGNEMFRLDVADSKSELAHMREQLLAAQDERQQASKGGSPVELAELENELTKANREIARLRREGEALQRLYSSQAATRLEVEQNRLALEKVEADKRLIEEKKHSLSERSKVQADRASLRADEARNSIQSLQQKVNSERVVSPITGTIYSLPLRGPAFVHEGDMLAELAD